MTKDTNGNKVVKLSTLWWAMGASWAVFLFLIGALTSYYKGQYDLAKELRIEMNGMRVALEARDDSFRAERLAQITRIETDVRRLEERMRSMEMYESAVHGKPIPLPIVGGTD